MVLLFCLCYSVSCRKPIVDKTPKPSATATKPSLTPPGETTDPFGQNKKQGKEAEKDPGARAVIDYFNFIRDKEYERAYNLTTGKFRETKGTLADFIARLSTAQAKGRIYENTEILEVTSSVSGMEKLVLFSLSVIDNQKPMTLTGHYFVYLQNGKDWKIKESISEK
jgi:hypothetical protein